MIMTVIALSFFPPFLLLAFTCTKYDLYLCFQLPKTNIVKRVHHTYLLASLLFHAYLLCLVFFQIKCLLVMQKLVSKALTNLMAHFIFFHLINLNHCDCP